MGYSVKIYVKESTWFHEHTNELPSGHAFIGLIGSDGEEHRYGFTSAGGWEVPGGFIGYGLGRVEEGSENGTPTLTPRTFEISEEQWKLINDEIKTIQNSKVNYDLLDGDTGRDDFNCVTFVEHLLRVGNVGGGNIKLGIIPGFAIDNSYMNEYSKAVWTGIQTIANNTTLKPPVLSSIIQGVIEFENGGIAYTKEGFEVISDTTSGVKVKAEYNQTNNQIAVSTNTETMNKNFLEGAMDFVTTTKADKITLNSQTFDIRNLSAIQLRNAIDGIDKVSFLLSNILIKVGEQIDLGAKGVYTVKSGDTLSVIAQNNGYVTKDLVKLNPWLFDDNRIQFNYPTKVLVAEGTVISDNVNHTIYGDASAENILIDHNGGDDNLYGGSKNDYIDGGKGEDTLSGGAGYDVLLGGNDSDLIYGGADDDTLIGGDDNASDALFGGSGADVLLGGGGDDTLAGGDATNLYGDKEIDYLEGGVGYDTYFVSHQDIISDADNSGFILFNDKQLNGKKTKLDENTYEDTNFTYSLDGNNLIVVDKNLGEYITIENFKDGAMGRNLDKEEKNAKDILVKISNLTCQDGLLHVVVNKRDFSTQKEVV